MCQTEAVGADSIIFAPASPTSEGGKKIPICPVLSCSIKYWKEIRFCRNSIPGGPIENQHFKKQAGAELGQAQPNWNFALMND